MYIAAFTEELVERIVRVHNYVGELVLKPSLSTDTASTVTRRLSHNHVGREVDLELREVIEEWLGINVKSLP
ncbi:MAG: hypothetical protein QXV95_07270 [Sulfolobales archaeon]